MNQEMCRTCLGQDRLTSLFDYVSDSTLGSMIMAVTSVMIDKDDHFPHKICAECVDKLQNSYAFKLQCQKSDEKLRRCYDLKNLMELRELYQKQFKISPAIKPEQKENISTEEIPPNDSIAAHSEVVEIPQCNQEYIVTDMVKVEIKKNSKKRQNQTSTENQPLNVVDNSIKSPINIPKKTRTKTSTQCSVCGKVVSSEFRLNCHMRIHTGEKPFKCEYCGKLFTLAYNLKVHERIHTGEKPLVCGICDKKFAQSAGLIAHMRLHTGEKPYKCTLCSMAFKTCSHLQYHIRLHTGEKNYGCTICSRAFITKGDLTQHSKTHTGERAHICSICGLRLSRNYHLTRHMVTHSGVKNFKCDICENAYSQKSDLTRHLKKHEDGNVIRMNSKSIKCSNAKEEPSMVEAFVMEQSHIEVPISIQLTTDKNGAIHLLHCDQ